MRFARQHAEKLPLEKIPYKDQWKKYDAESESYYTVEYGIDLKRLGFKNTPIASGYRGDIIDCPQGLDRELFNCKDRRTVYSFARGFYKPRPENLIPGKSWVDKTLLLDQFRLKQNQPLLRLIKYGDFIQCHNNIERIIHRYLMGGSMPVIYVIKQWRTE